MRIVLDMDLQRLYYIVLEKDFFTAFMSEVRALVYLQTAQSTASLIIMTREEFYNSRLLVLNNFRIEV